MDFYKVLQVCEHTQEWYISGPSVRALCLRFDLVLVRILTSYTKSGEWWGLHVEGLKKSARSCTKIVRLQVSVFTRNALLGGTRGLP